MHKRLSHGLGLDGVVDTHGPFHVEHAFGQPGREGRPFGDAPGEVLRRRHEIPCLDQPVEEAPAFSLRAGK